MRSVGLVLIACLAIVLAACSGDTSSSRRQAHQPRHIGVWDRCADRGWPARLPGGPARVRWATDRLLLLNCVGQEGTGSTTEQVWSWDGSAWTLVADDGPPAMLVTGVAYDTDRQVMVRYGGQPLTGTDCAPETWEWDGATGAR